MKNGNWVPISKAFVSYLPKSRAYTELEAAYCLQVDYDNGKSVSVSGYAALWGWSRTRIRGFLNRMKIEINYKEDTAKRQNQKGQIEKQIRDRSDEKKGQIRFIDFKGLRKKKNRSDEKKEQIEDRSKNSTIYPSINPNPKGRRGLHSLPKDFQITDDLKKWANRTGYGHINLDLETEKFKNYWQGNGKRRKDWAATWRNWIIRASEYNKQNNSGGGDPGPGRPITDAIKEIHAE
ncbi:MAG: hypothetical protein GY850_06475 [bacterium]|nr:hypothetical protein [bacterium]